jgi:hypothetical protein
MTNDDEPLIRLEQGGSAPILSYDIPQPAIYFGTNFIELDYGEDVFTPAAWERPDVPPDDSDSGPPDDSDSGPPDDSDSGPPDGSDSGPPDDSDSGPPDDSDSGPPDDSDSGPPDDPRFPGRPSDPDDPRFPGRPPGDRDGGTVQPFRVDVSEMSDEELEREVERSMKSGFSDKHVLPNARIRSGKLRFSENSPLRLETDLPVSEGLESLDAEEIVEMKKAGKELDFYSSMYGGIRYRYIDRTTEAEPAFLLVETYRLASYLGSYGAGKVIKTFSLFPGERTTISIRTFRKSEKERKEASSILDSFTEESATDFERTIENEQSNKEEYEKSFEYYSDAEAAASWGWGSAKVEGGVKGGTNSAREEFAKNSTTATDKHAQKASAKREVDVDTSYESRETEEEETSIEREIENINLGRTLNFVFRQMNQEFVSITSLVDVRVAFFNGFTESREEVTLPELDSLLETYVKADQRDRVRGDIHDSLGSVLDHEGNLHEDFIEERTIDEDNRYHRVRSEKTSTYRDPVTGTEIEVPGIIVSATENSMRTDGVLVEALLGTSGALDQYAERLQELEVERREAELAGTRAETALDELANSAIRDNDEARVELVRRLSSHSDRRRGQESGDGEGSE